jgi:phospholipid/cholesterol/gamma-HCH transport system permease protein
LLTATLQIVVNGAGVTLVFAGRLDAFGIGPLWAPVLRAARSAKEALAADLSAVTVCDTGGIALLLAAEAAHAAPLALVGETPQLRDLIKRVRAVPIPAARPRLAAWTYLDVLQRGSAAAADGVAYMGEALLALLRLPARRRMFRLPDMFAQADMAGVRAVPLVLLMGFLIGLILAFQSAIPLRAYGADLLVAYLVSVSLIRELGPLLASVILAGRTGSAYAAELGTMKVNEELDALSSMGLDIMTMQVLPRMAAAMLVMPILTMLLILAGLGGMTAVMVGMGFSPDAIVGQLRRSVHLTDLLGGLFKALCFGATDAAIGCRAGLATGAGPRAVGMAATSAVVGGIVATIVLDGAFALLFYRLNL